MAYAARLEPQEQPLEQRAHPRRTLRLEVAAAMESGLEVNATILSISRNGLLLETDASLAPDDEIEVLLPNAGAHPAKVVWASNGLAGCKFDLEISDAILSAAELQSSR